MHFNKHKCTSNKIPNTITFDQHLYQVLFFAPTPLLYIFVFWYKYNMVFSSLKCCFYLYIKQQYISLFDKKIPLLSHFCLCFLKKSNLHNLHFKALHHLIMTLLNLKILKSEYTTNITFRMSSFLQLKFTSCPS